MAKTARSKIYLDYAASTPVDPRVERAMRPYFFHKFGNAGSLHSFGQEAIAAVDASRETIARLLDADFREIIFTGSATEANNFALRGVIKYAMQKMRIHANAAKNFSHHSHEFVDSHRVRMIVSSVEHESILNTARDLEREGTDVVYLPVDKKGIVDLKKLCSALNEKTFLVSVMYANNETGIVQPIVEISRLITDFRKEIVDRSPSGSRHSPFAISHWPLFHTDAAQAFQFLDCNPAALGADLITFSAHKIYGPKGIGALYVKRATWNTKQKSDNMLHALITGGGQEFGLRSGTENVPAIVGFARAAELAVAARMKEAGRIAGLRDYFWGELRRMHPLAEINGAGGRLSKINDQTLPNILNVYFSGRKTEEMIAMLDLLGIAVSSGSACRSRTARSSHVLEAMGFAAERAKSSIRFSFGRPTTKGEVARALNIVKKSLSAWGNQVGAR